MQALRHEKPIPNWFNPDATCLRVSRALPFYQSNSGLYVHRPRSGWHHYYSGKYSHTSFTLWCGMIGFLSPRKGRRGGGKMLATPPADAVFCATCEGRAIGAGLLGVPTIDGRPVRFSPRH